ncbi:MAG: hypothetical protein ABL985_12670 [Casimicrobium sp.]
MQTKQNTIIGGARKALVAAVCCAIAVPSFANTLTAGPVVGTTDFAMFGIGGLRGTGNGTITVSGVTGTVTRAILVWHGVSNSSTALARTGTIGATNFSGTNIGLSDNNCWSQISSQAFQADVTSAITGNGTYALSNMRTASTFDPNGASLLVFYNDGNSTNNRDIAVFWGNDSNIANAFDPAGWQASLSGINYTSGAANLNLVVADGQSAPDGARTATINSVAFATPSFDGNTVPTAPGSAVTSGSLWDHFASPVTSYLVPGPNTLAFNATGGSSDCLSLVGAVFDLPAGTVTPPQPVVAVEIPTLSALGFGGMSLSAALWGVYALRNRRREGTEIAQEAKSDQA